MTEWVSNVSNWEEPLRSLSCNVQKSKIVDETPCFAADGNIVACVVTHLFSRVDRDENAFPPSLAIVSYGDCEIDD